MRPSLFWLAALAAALVTARPSVAHATANFPNAIFTQLSLDSVPDCSLCHANGVTGSGTVTTPFGAKARSFGLVANDVNSLKGVLGRMEGEGTDSDGDGVSNIAELRAGTDPNVEPGGSSEQATYGCVGRIAGGHDEPSAALLAALLTGVVLARRAVRRR